jgi:hypothetical protein
MFIATSRRSKQCFAVSTRAVTGKSRDRAFINLQEDVIE